MSLPMLPRPWWWPMVRNTLTGQYVPAGATPFVIVYLPRTGSNYLAALLDSHPSVLCHHEIFNPTGIHRALSYKHTDLSFGTVAERDRDPWAFMSRVYSFTAGKAAVGFKLGPGHIFTWPLLSLLLHRRVRKIVLERRGWLHAYSSTMIARATQEWSRPTGAAPATAAPAPKVHVNVADFQQFVRRRQRFYHLARLLLRVIGQPHLFLAYEDIGEPGTMARLLRFLGVDPDVALSSRTAKQNSPCLADRIANYSEVVQARAGSSFLDPVEAEAF